MNPFVFLLALLVAVLFVPANRYLKRARRNKLKARPFPRKWRTILLHRYDLYKRLPYSLKEELHKHIRVFLAEKNYEGCGGLTITEEMKVTIAAQACTLLLNRDTDYYPGVDSILVYPDSFMVKTYKHIGKGVNLEGQKALIGESWKAGVVILAWNQLVKNAPNVDNRNVTFHEFAHQLDYEDRNADGVPVLKEKAQYLSWTRVLSKEFKSLRKCTQCMKSSLLDEYGGTNPAEFFAVITEVFFENGKAMQKEHPELYQELSAYYCVDPAAWV